MIDEITPEFLGDIEVLVPTSQELQDRIANAASISRSARENAIEHLMEAVDLIEEGIEHRDH